MSATVYLFITFIDFGLLCDEMVNVAEVPLLFMQEVPWQQHLQVRLGKASLSWKDT